VKLTDGSVIHLNTRSRIQVRYSDEARRIDLLEGEAFFAVGRDPARPFTVMVGSTTVQALGTQFNVYREDARTTVSVAEGKVQVAAGAQPVPLEKGEAAQVLYDRRVVKTAAPEITHATAWRQRQLDFRRATLLEVAAEFNRYNTLKIEIADPEIGERRLNGVFDADMPEQLLKFLEQRQDLRFERTDGTVVIHAREK
jgi:transmembrane sensor